MPPTIIHDTGMRRVVATRNRRLAVGVGLVIVLALGAVGVASLLTEEEAAAPVLTEAEEIGQVKETARERAATSVSGATSSTATQETLVKVGQLE